jgi:hypothetical protein
MLPPLLFAPPLTSYFVSVRLQWLSLAVGRGKAARLPLHLAYLPNTCAHSSTGVGRMAQVGAACCHPTCFIDHTCPVTETFAANASYHAADDFFAKQLPHNVTWVLTLLYAMEQKGAPHII